MKHHMQPQPFCLHIPRLRLHIFTPLGPIYRLDQVATGTLTCYQDSIKEFKRQRVVPAPQSARASLYCLKLVAAPAAEGNVQQTRCILTDQH